MFRILVAFFAAASVAATQTAPRTPTFGAGTDVVSLTATVTDEHGRYVTDLTIKDFAVHEDMVPQELSPELFSHE